MSDFPRTENGKLLDIVKVVTQLQTINQTFDRIPYYDDPKLAKFLELARRLVEKAQKYEEEKLNQFGPFTDIPESYSYKVLAGSRQEAHLDRDSGNLVDSTITVDTYKTGQEKK